jgi:hypothetical protein
MLTYADVWLMLTSLFGQELELKLYRDSQKKDQQEEVMCLRVSVRVSVCVSVTVSVSVSVSASVCLFVCEYVCLCVCARERQRRRDGESVRRETARARARAGRESELARDTLDAPETYDIQQCRGETRARVRAASPCRLGSLPLP